MTYLNFGHTASPEEYQKTVAQVLAEVVNIRVESFALADAHLHFAAEAVIAPSDVPAFANSQMDGYALTAAASQRENRVFRVGQDIAAGSQAQVEVHDDIVYPIMTGAPLPAGYDCVVPEERAKPLGERDGSFAVAGSLVELPQASAGQFVRYPGEDIRSGETLLDAGARLTGATLGALAAQGIGEVSVKATLNILVLTGGDEVTEAGAELTQGKIFDANGPMLAAQLAEFGANVTRHHLSDTPEELVSFLENYLTKNTVDLILSSGGISHGKYEVIKNAVQLLSKKNSELRVLENWFGHVTQQPGGPQGITLIETEQRVVPLLSFPGNPVSTLITYTLVLQPAFYWMYTGREPARYHGKLEGAEMSAPANKTQFRRARTTPTPEGFSIEADQATGSHLLHRAASANALIELEPGATYRTGDILRWYPLNNF